MYLPPWAVQTLHCVWFSEMVLNSRKTTPTVMQWGRIVAQTIGPCNYLCRFLPCSKISSPWHYILCQWIISSTPGTRHWSNVQITLMAVEVQNKTIKMWLGPTWPLYEKQCHGLLTDTWRPVSKSEVMFCLATAHTYNHIYPYTNTWYIKYLNTHNI